MKNEAHYEHPVNLYISKSYDDAETAQNFIKPLAGEQLTVSKSRNGDYLYVSLEGSNEDIDAFLDVYKDKFTDIVWDCDADANGWVKPKDVYDSIGKDGKVLPEESKVGEGRSNEDYLQEVWDSLAVAWDTDKFNMGKGYDSEYECECITITSKDNEEVRAKIYVEDYNGSHPVAFNVVYRYPGDKGIGVMGTYEFQSTDMDGLGEEVFDYFDEIKQKVGESKKSEDFDMNKAFFQAKKAITDWTTNQKHKTLEWLYTDGRKSPTSYPSGIWDFEWDTGDGMATAELKVSPYETRMNSWNDSLDFALKSGPAGKYMYYTSAEDVLYALDKLIRDTEFKGESKKSEAEGPTTGDDALKQMQTDFKKYNGKTTGEIAADIRYDVATALDMPADEVDDVMQSFGLDNIYILRAKGVSPKAIAQKMLKANNESKKSELDETSWALEYLVKIAKEKGLRVSWEDVNEICITVGTFPLQDHIFVTDDAPGKVDTSLELYVPAAHINTSGLTLQDVLDYLDDPIGKRDAVQFKNGNRSGKVEAKKDNVTILNATVQVDSSSANTIHKALEDAGIMSEDDTIRFTAKFENGYEMDIKCCGADEDVAWTEAILYDNQGHEVMVSDVCDDYFGEWELEDDKGNKYVANVIAPTHESVSESLTLKQKELKDMARYGQAEDITTISDAEAKELKKKGIETVGVSRGVYGMNGALLRDSEGNKYVITARSSNLFYFV